MKVQTNDRCISISAHGEDSQATTGTRFATKHNATRRIIAICLAVSLVGCSGMSPRVSTQSSDTPNTNVVAESETLHVKQSTERNEFEPEQMSAEPNTANSATPPSLADDAVGKAIRKAGNVALLVVLLPVMLPLMLMSGIH